VSHIPHQLGEGLAAGGLYVHPRLLRPRSQLAAAGIVARLRDPKFQHTLGRALEHGVDGM
jgi:hypothetical protein